MQEIWNQLTKEIKNHETILIMAHQNLDYDALGSMLCLHEIVSSFEKKNFLFLDTSISNMDSSLQKAFSKIKKLNTSYLYPNHYKEYLGDNPLLIILDTHKKERLSHPSILEEVKDVIVIDHHIKGTNYIKNTILNYMNSSLSSITEFMVRYARYLNKEIHPEIATIMLAGIAIDTNEYRMKTSESTYEASSLLMKMGADNIGKLEFMKESKEEYLKRLDFVKNSDMINNNMALCMMKNAIVTQKDLAIVSESLLQFDNVEAAFTIGQIDNDIIGISARSIGNINVEEIMESLNGGGHMTEAATQLKNVSIEEAKEKLLEIIR